jgi:hypothetical protein
LLMLAAFAVLVKTRVGSRSTPQRATGGLLGTVHRRLANERRRPAEGTPSAEADSASAEKPLAEG